MPRSKYRYSTLLGRETEVGPVYIATLLGKVPLELVPIPVPAQVCILVLAQVPVQYPAQIPLLEPVTVLPVPLLYSYMPIPILVQVMCVANFKPMFELIGSHH